MKKIRKIKKAVIGLLVLVLSVASIEVDSLATTENDSIETDSIFLYMAQDGEGNPIRLECDYSRSFEYEGHTYYIVNPVNGSEIDWYDAEAICEALGRMLATSSNMYGHLCAITSVEEQEKIVSEIKALPEDEIMNNYWIGAYENFEYEEWTWITDENFCYSNWAKGEPNNCFDKAEGYAHLIAGDYTNLNRDKTVGTWNDASQDGAGYADKFFNLYNYGFICEIDTISVDTEDHTYDNKQVAVNGVFSFELGAGDGSIATTDFYYRDSYFSESSSSYNASLASMSISMALAGFGTPISKSNPKNFNKNIAYVYDQIGFENECSYIADYDEFAGDNIESAILYTSKGGLSLSGVFLEDEEEDEKPNSTDSSIGVHFATKKIRVEGEIRTVISVVLRGGGYDYEWASNFAVGEMGNHEGFSMAAKTVWALLNNYVRENRDDIESPILWITGYSRAAAASNLLAAGFDNGQYNLDGYELSKNGIYAYCFETPQGALDDGNTGSSTYSNIYNVINPADLVTYIVPSASPFSFTRYGKDFILLAPENSKNYKNYLGTMKEQLTKILKGTKSADENYLIDEFSIPFSGKSSVTDVQTGEVYKTKKSLSLFWNEFLGDAFVSIFENRFTYVSEYQEIIKNAVAIAFVDNDQFKLQISENVEVNWQAIVCEFFTKQYGKFVDDITEILLSDTNFNEVMKEDEKYLTYSGDDFEADLKIAVKKILHELGFSDYLYNPPTNNYVNEIFTLLYNSVIKSCNLTSPHYPENELAWVRVFDANYAQSYFLWKLCAGYRKLVVNCPIDIMVYDSSGELMAEITDDTVNESCEGIYAIVDENEQKIVYVPYDDEYTVELVATDKGTMDCSIQEYSYKANAITSVNNYYDIPLEKNDTFKLLLGSNQTEYKIVSSKDTTYSTDAVLSGAEEIQKHKYTVNVKMSDTAAGIVQGGGTFKEGEYSLVRATANKGYKFVGWYADSKKISEKESYRFRVNSNIEITAIFEIDSSNANNIKKTYGNNDAKNSNVKNNTSKLKIAKTKIKFIKNSGKRAVTVKYNKLKNAKKYEVQYATNRKFTKSKKIKKTKKKKIIIRKLKKGRTYYVRVRGVNGKTKGKWSKVKKVYIAK